MRNLKKVTDERDAVRAKTEYRDKPEDYAAIFSYRKGKKRIPLKQDAQIARKFRKIEGEPRFWDYDDEEVEGAKEGAEIEEEEEDQREDDDLEAVALL